MGNQSKGEHLVKVIPSHPARLLVAAAVTFLAGGGSAQQDAAPAGGDFSTDTHSFQEVASGVYFVRYTVPMFNSNSLVVVNDEDVLVVDSHITPATARALIASIRTVTDKPVTTLVNTHFHYDHAHGNQAFGPVQIVGHEFTRRKMAGTPLEEGTFQSELMRQPQTLANLQAALEKAEDAEARQGLEQRIALQNAHMEATGEVDPVPPDTTLSERLSLFRGSREIQVIFCGRAHTGGDVVVYLPEEKIVFTGDMMLGGPSWLGDGHVDEWPDTLEKLKELDFDLMLPGHGGPVRDRERIDHVQAYYRDLWAQTVALRAGGASIGDAASKIDLTGHKDTLGIARVGADPMAVGRIYALLDERGE